MQKRISSKNIIVLHRGPIHAKGWMYGPITHPYKEQTNIIFEMLSQPISEIFEVLPNGKKVKLDINNFDSENFAYSAEAPVIEAPIAVDTVEENVVTEPIVLPLEVEPIEVESFERKRDKKNRR